MSSELTATFTTRRDAELVIERLVQEYKVDRKAITVGPEGDLNTVGEETSGGDLPAGEPAVKARNDAPVEGRVVVKVAADAVSDPAAVREAFREFDGDRQ
jgi:hypothetical protein